METRQTVIAKVTRFVDTTYASDWQKAFNAYAVAGKTDHGTLVTILSDAGVGTLIGRQLIANEVIKLFDSDGDGALTWAEFDAIAQVTPPTPPPVPPSH